MRNILLGVTGSVASIKVAELALSLKKFAHIKIITTKFGNYFIQHDLNVFAENKINIYQDEDEWPQINKKYEVGTPILHIEMRRWADLLVIAPLDANTLAKISNGFSDNLLTSVFRAWDWNKPVVLCPAMNTFMWENNPTQEQILTLKKWGASIIEPINKKLACNDIGMGGMAATESIATYIKDKLS